MTALLAGLISAVIFICSILTRQDEIDILAAYIISQIWLAAAWLGNKINNQHNGKHNAD